MCTSCWQAYGMPSHTSPAIQEAADLVRAVYAEHPAGGLTHCVLDDWNLDNDSLDWCLHHEEAGLPEHASAIACMRAFRALSEDDRAAALAWAEGYAP